MIEFDQTSSSLLIEINLFGLVFEWLEAPCEQRSTKIAAINGDKLSPSQEMVADFLAIVTVFRARFHRLQSYRKAIKNACEQKDQD